MATGIILGTVQFGLEYGINNTEGKPGEEKVDEIFQEAHRTGIRKLDTAGAYGNAQDIIGSFHKKQTIRFEVNTKFKGISEIQLRSELTECLEKLYIDRADTYFYHSFSDYTSSPGILNELKKMRSDKLIRKIGLSVYSNNELEMAVNDPDIDVIQLPFNLLDNISQRGRFLKEAKRQKKQVQVRSVFLQGLFFKSIETLPVFLLPLKPYLQKLQQLVKQSGLTMEELCLCYANAQPEIDELIIGVDTRLQLTANMTALGKTLDTDILAAVDGIEVKETALLYPHNWK